MDEAEYDCQMNVGLLRKCGANASGDSDYLLLLMAKIKTEQQTPYSITTVIRILDVSAFAKTPIRALLADTESTIKN